jgi:ornithine decarboxylase
MRVMRASGEREGRVQAFDLFGPTCDSIDSMPGPHLLATEVGVGDWVEVGMMGAYSNALRTQFNGFGGDAVFVVDDAGWYLPGLRDARPALAA